VVSLRKDPKLQEQLNSLNLEQLANYILESNRICDYQDTINIENNILDDTPTKEIIIKNISDRSFREALIETLSRNPEKLVVYYRGYGFREKEYTFRGIFMEAELADILENCKLN
jgi:hypothetical protein